MTDEALWNSPFAEPEENPDKGGASILDQGLNLVSQTIGSVAPYGGAAQAGLEQAGFPAAGKIAGGLGLLAKGASDVVSSGMSEGGIRARDAQAIPDAGHAKLTEHPLDTAFMNLGSIAPIVAQFMLVPEGIIPNLIAGAASGGATHAGEIVNHQNSLDDDELKKESPVYKQLREGQGIDEDGARKLLREGTVQAMPVIANAVAGAAGMGAPARILKGAAAASGKGVVGRVAGGATEAGLGMTGMGVAGDYGQQSAEIASGASKSEDTDWYHTLAAGFNEGVKGVFVGGAMGGLHGRHGATPDGKPAPQVEVTDPLAPPVDQKMALDTVNPQPAQPAADPSAPAPASPTPASSPNAPADQVTAIANKISGDAALAANAKQQAATQAAQGAAPGMQAPVEGSSPLAPAPERPTAPGPEPTSAPLDTGMNVPEAPATLNAQLGELAAGRRKAVMFPKGTDAPTKDQIPPGMKSAVTGRGTFIYDPNQLKRADIYAASKGGRENELLDLGPISKPEVDARVQQGEAPIAVTERAPDGTEMKAAAGTDQTAPVQAAALEAQKAPGSSVQVEPIAKVLADRQSPLGHLQGFADKFDATPKPAEAPREAAPEPDRAVAVLKERAVKEGDERSIAAQAKAQEALRQQTLDEIAARKGERRILPTVGEEAYTGNSAAEVKLTPAEQRALNKAAAATDDGEVRKGDQRTGRHESKEQVAAREANNARAKDLVERAIPEKVAPVYTPKDKQALKQRLGQMLQAAKLENVELPTQKVTATTGDHVAYLKAAERIHNKLENGKISYAQLNDFLASEHAARGGDFNPLRKSRLEEGDQAMRKDQGGIETDEGAVAERLSTHETPESILEDHEENHNEASMNSPNEKGVERAKVIDPLAALSAEERARVKKVQMLAERGATEGERSAAENRLEALTGKAEDDAVSAYVTKGEDKAGKFNLVKTRRKVEIPGKKEVSREARPALREDNSHTDELARLINENSLDYAPPEHTHTGSYGGFTPTHSMSLSTALEGAKKFTVPSAINNILAPFIRSKLKQAIPNMPVHVVTRAEMNRMMRNDPRDNGRTEGFFDPKTQSIVIANDLKSHRVDGTLIHEGIHGMTHQALRTNPAFRAVIRRMMDAVADTHGEDVRKRYGMTDEDEFLAEAHADNTFQELLATTPLDPRLARDLGLPEFKKFSVWRGLVESVRRLMRLPPGTHTALEGAMSATAHLSERHLPMDVDTFENNYLDNRPAMRQGAPSGGPEDLFKRSFSEMLQGNASHVVNAAHSAVNSLVQHPAETARGAFNGMTNNANFTSKVRAMGRAWETTHQLADKMGRLFSGEREDNVIRQITDNLAKTGVRTQELKQEGNKLIKGMYNASKVSPGTFQRFSTLVHEATRYGVDPSADIGTGRNQYLQLSKNVREKLAKGASWDDVAHEVNLEHLEAHDNHARLSEEYRQIVKDNPDFAPLMEHTFKYFEDAQSAMTHNAVQNLLRAAGLPEHELAGRATSIMAERNSEKHLQDLDDEFGEATRKEIVNAKKASGKNGPYVPLQRFGQHVIVGKYKAADPKGNFTRINDDTVEFKTRKEAADYARQSGLAYDVAPAYYDPVTGKRTTKEGGTSTAGTAEQRWQTTLNRKHVEFHDDLNEARARVKQLRDSGELESVTDPLRHRDFDGRSSELTGQGMQTILQSLYKQDSYRNATPAVQADMRNALTEASTRMLSGNRMQSRRLPRRNVEGYSDDIQRNMDAYNKSQAAYRAKQEFRPHLEDALSRMQEEEHALRHDKDASLRSDYVKDLINRVHAEDPANYTGAYSELARRLGVWSYIDRMARPSHLILHQTHLPMITGPIISGRHGPGRTYGNIAKAWKTMFGAYKAGGEDFVKSIADGLHQGVNYTELAKRAFSKDADAGRLNGLFDYMTERGIIHPEAGMEIEKYSPHKRLSGPLGMLDAGMMKMDTVFRHLTNSTEAINRHVGAVVAYRLEYARGVKEGKSSAEAHALAVEYARKTVMDTEGYYASHNAAPVFKNKWLKPFLQFRQFPQMMYHLLGKTTVKMLTGATTREKLEGLRSLSYILGTHTLMTGLLGGLPLEGPKIVLTAAKALGITDSDWSDFERWEYDTAVKIFGKTGADYVMHGLSRAMGQDAHHRLGLNSFLTFGMPDKWDKQSTWAWLASQAAGAPGGLAGDMFTGVHQMMDGDIAGGALKAFPLQALRDVQKAWTGKSGDYTYSPGERVSRVLGFTPSGEAEHYENKHELKRQVGKYTDERNSLMRKWRDADPQGRKSLNDKINKFNSDKPKEAQISQGDLYKSLEATKKREKTKVDGVSLSKRTKFLADRAHSIY